MAKRISSPLLRYSILFFSLMYSLQLVMACWDPYNVYPLSIETFILFNLQILFFIIGASIKPKKRLLQINPSSFKLPHININTFCVIVVTVLLIHTYNNYEKMHAYVLSLGSLTNQSREFYYTEFFRSYTDLMLNQIIIAAKYVAIFVSFSILFSKNRKYGIKDLYVIIATFASVALEALTTMGRNEALTVAFMLLFFAVFCKLYQTDVYKKRIIPVAIVSIVGFAVIFMALTLIRSNLIWGEFADDSTEDLILKPFSTYFYVPILAFDFGKETILHFDYPFMGGATLAGFIDTLLTPVLLISKNMPTINSILGGRMTPSMVFPGGEGWNALYTGCANYYIDFKHLGFIIFPFIHGKIFAWLSYKCNKDVIAMMLLCVLYFFSFKHLVSLTIQSSDIVFIILWVYLFSRFSVVKFEKA